jgi:hypothetical protein
LPEKTPSLAFAPIFPGACRAALAVRYSPPPLPPYARMARFASTDAARAAYRTIQDYIFRHEDVALSVYNLVVARVPHVVVLGERPGTDINAELTALLADGAVTQLPPGLVAQLAARRARQDGPGPERHPGRPGAPLA